MFISLYTPKSHKYHIFSVRALVFTDGMNMEGFALGIKKRGKRRRGVQSVAQRAVVASFADGEDSDDSQPRAKLVKRMVPSAPQKDTKAQNSTESKAKVDKRSTSNEAYSAASGPKQSQIARLVARRKKAQQEVEPVSSGGDGTDGAMFRYDVEKCPEHAGLAAYKSTPVEGFGVSLLAAMGWKGAIDGKDKNEDGLKRKPRLPRLGLGAKIRDIPLPNAQKRTGHHLPRPNRAGIVLDLETEKVLGNASEDETSGKARSRQVPSTFPGSVPKTSFHPDSRGRKTDIGPH